MEVQKQIFKNAAVHLVIAQGVYRFHLIIRMMYHVKAELLVVSDAAPNLDP